MVIDFVVNNNLPGFEWLGQIEGDMPEEFWELLNLFEFRLLIFGIKLG